MIAQLLPLPCGCVIDADEIISVLLPTGDVIESQVDATLVADPGEVAACPWCSASFDVREWVTWLSTLDAAPMWIKPSQPWPVRRVVKQLSNGFSADGGGK